MSTCHVTAPDDWIWVATDVQVHTGYVYITTRLQPQICTKYQMPYLLFTLYYLM